MSPHRHELRHVHFLDLIKYHYLSRPIREQDHNYCMYKDQGQQVAEQAKIIRDQDRAT